MKRFLVLASVLVAACTAAVGAQDSAGAPRKLNHKAMDKLGWKLSCQAYTFRDRTAFEAIDTVRSLGVRYIEFYPGQKFSKERPDAKLDHNMSPELLAELQQKLRDSGVTAMNYGVVGFGSDETGARKVFDWAKKMGIQTIVSEPPQDTLPLLDRLAQEYGINVAFHNHPKPSRYWNPETVLEALQGRSQRLGSCSDTGHWYRSGLAPVECLKKLEGHIISMHFKDLNDQKQDVPWGTGNCDARAMLEELKRQKVRPVISVEYETGSGRELDENVAKCVDWFSAQATQLARGKKK